LTVRLEPLTRDELEKIHDATVRILESTGIRVLEPEAVELLKKAGASVDKKSNVVKIPEDVLKDCISAAPRRFKLYGRGSKNILSFGEGNVYMSSMGTAVQVEDTDGVVRTSTLKDVENLYRLTDALPHIDHSSWVVWPRDVPEELGHVYEILLGFRHTSKPIDGYNWGREKSQDTVDMAAIVAGGYDAIIERPMLLGFCNPVSPLTLAKETTEGLIVYAKYGQPSTIPPECMAGGTAPSTLTGLLVQQNAEILASISVAQCARRGAPVLYGSVSTVMDMRTGAVALGAPESGLIMAGSAQLARYYGIPSRGTGGNTESITADFQAGVESATTLLMAALAGFDFIYDCAGSIESSLTASYTKLVLDDDVCGEVKRIISGIDVSEETLAAEVIESVGLKGAYLGHPHTLKHFRKEHCIPSLFRREPRRSSGTRIRMDLREGAKSTCEKILREHMVDPPLESDVEGKLIEFLKKVRKRQTS